MIMGSNLNKIKQIAKNTTILYFRMIVLMLISLYVSRVVLDTLGVVDFGVYNVVFGFVALFSILSGSLTAAISRFITFELGKKNELRLKQVFSISVTVLVILAIIIVLLSETLGLYLFNVKIVIPPERVTAAFWCYQLSVVTFIINLLSIPYNACIVAHEQMSAFAYISILDGLGKLLIAISLNAYEGDKLVLYALLLMLLSVVICLFYGMYCKRKFSECSFKFNIDVKLFKELFAFSSWNFIGAASGILRDYGGSVLLNIFFGPSINAARGLAMQVNSAVSSFSTNFMTALNPQIIKTYAENDKDYLFKLLFGGAKCAFFPLLLISLPIIFNVDYILKIWLKTIPDYTSIFVILSLVNVMCESISYPMVTAMLATGKIRNYQLVVGGIQMLNFPLSYIWLRNGGNAISVFIISIIISQLCLYSRLYMLRGMIGLPIKAFLFKVYFRSILLVVFSIVIPYMVIIIKPTDNETARFFLVTIASIISSLFFILFIGCNRNERQIIITKIRETIKR